MAAAFELSPDECEERELLNKIEECLTISGKVKVLRASLKKKGIKNVRDSLNLTRFKDLERKEHSRTITRMLKVGLRKRSLNTDVILGIEFKERDIRVAEKAKWEEYIQSLGAIKARVASALEPMNLEQRREQDREDERWLYRQWVKEQDKLGQEEDALEGGFGNTFDSPTPKKQLDAGAGGAAAAASSDISAGNTISPQVKYNPDLGQNNSPELTSPDLRELKRQSLDRIEFDESDLQREEEELGDDLVCSPSRQGSPKRRRTTELCPNCNPAGLCEVHAMFNLNLRF